MGLIERIKDFFNRNKTKALPEPEVFIEESVQENDNSWIIDNGTGYYKEQLTRAEMDIKDFLDKYYQRISQVNLEQPTTNYSIAYTSLVSSNIPVTQEQYNCNALKENEFLNNLSINSNFRTAEENGFYHIMTQGHRLPRSEDLARVYLCCENENISEIAQMLCSYNTNPNFYMKFISNQSNTEAPRNEKIVIYCNKNEIDYTLGLIQNCKSINPSIFNTPQNLPFLKSEQGIATVAYEPPTNQYVGLNGQTKQIPQSVNAFITNILQESYMEAAREIARVDNNLTFLLDPSNYSQETLYMQNYPYILETNGDYLLKSIKAKLDFLATKNHISIEGLNQEQQYTINQQQREEYEL